MKRIIFSILMLASFAATSSAQTTAYDYYRTSKRLLADYKNVTPEQFAEGFMALEKSADMGFDSAQVDLGLIYESYHLYDYSFKYYRRAAQSGNATAMNNMGVAYQNGWGVSPNKDRAFPWFQKAVDAGNAKSIPTLAYCYLYGWGTKKDLAKARELGTKAVEQDVVDGYAVLALADYYSGDPELKKKSVLLFSEAAIKGSSSADQFILSQSWDSVFSTLSAYGTPGQIFNEAMRLYKLQRFEKAFPCLQLAASRGVAEANLYVGKCFQYGRGVKINVDSAKAYYKAGARLGISESYDALIYISTYSPRYNADADTVGSDLLEMGNLFVQNGNNEAALEYYLKAVDKGSIRALEYIGSLYLITAKKQADYDSAYAWYSRAAVFGHPEAQYQISCMYYDNKLGELSSPDSVVSYDYFAYIKNLNKSESQIKAFEWCYKAVNQNHIDAIIQLADFYNNAVGTSQDFQMALDLLDVAIQKGSIDAEIALGVIYKKYDLVRAVKIFEKLASDGNWKAYYQLSAIFFENPRLQNVDMSFGYACKAAESEEPEAEYLLALFYLYGQGTKKDAVKAFELAYSSANKGYKDAMSLLSQCYRNGVGTKVNEYSANYWAKMAGE